MGGAQRETYSASFFTSSIIKPAGLGRQDKIIHVKAPDGAAPPCAPHLALYRQDFGAKASRIA